MYNQFNSYRQQSGFGTGVATTTTSTASTQQQPSSTSGGGGLMWNGTAWVPASSVGPTNTTHYSSYASALTTMSSSSHNNNNNSSFAASSTAQQQPTAQQQQTPQQLVATYTQYYHGWKAKEQEQERVAQSLAAAVGGGRQKKEEALQQVQWAKYYADLASAAAHHYHNYINVSSSTTGGSMTIPMIPPPSTALPPAPPPSSSSSVATISAVSTPAATTTTVPLQAVQPTTATAATVRQTTAQPMSRSAVSQAQPPQPPEGLKRYVHKCLQQCTGKSQHDIQQMQRRVEQVIAESIRNGTMHTTDWDNKAVLLPTSTTTTFLAAVDQPPAPKQQQHPSPVVDTAAVVQSSGGTAAAVKRFRQQGGTINNNAATTTTTATAAATSPSVSYYGPSSTTTTANDSLQQVKHARRPAAAGVRSSSRDYYGPMNVDKDDDDNEKYRTKWTLQDKFPTSSKGSYGPQDFTSSDNYYGNAKDFGDDEEDFVPLSSNKLVRRKRKRTDKKKTTTGNVKVKKDVIMQSDKGGGLDKSSKALEKRANRFGTTSSGVAKAASLSKTATNANKNMDRFMGMALIGGSSKNKLDETDYEHMKVKGTCQTLEKEYLRLTAPPRAELVRPQPILNEHMENLKVEWMRGRPKRHDYLWFCSQLKAVRQDLTVQQIVNAFAVNVYETHARIALEEGDLNEYNQCQTQLKQMYKACRSDSEATKNQNEFIAYRLIYYVFLQGNKKYEGGSSDLFNIMLSLTPEQRQDPFISHALNVRIAVAEYDYHAFFRLLKHCSEHGTYLMNYMIPKVRHWSLQRICKAYRPSVSTQHVLQALGFDVDKDLDHGKKWLTSCGVALSENGDDVLTKDSAVRESDLAEKASSLI